MPRDCDHCAITLAVQRQTDYRVSTGVTCVNLWDDDRLVAQAILPQKAVALVNLFDNFVPCHPTQFELSFNGPTRKPL